MARSYDERYPNNASPKLLPFTREQIAYIQALIGSGGSGAGFVVPDSATIPFANIAARDTWAAANLGDLVENQTVVSVTGSPSNTWYLWRGDSNPSSYNAANWIDATPLIQGDTGAQGPTGASGTDGRSILNGSGAPLPSLGEDGDFYIDTTNNEIYGPKTSGAWGAGTSIVGPQGSQGVAGPPGDQFDTVEINSDVTITTANLSTYREKDVTNVSTGLPNVTVTLSNISTFLASDPNADFVIRFINQNGPSSLVVATSSGDQIGQQSGSVTLGAGESITLKIPSSGTRWIILGESLNSSGATTPPTTPLGTPEGDVILRGTFDATQTSFPAGASQGALYQITQAGTLDGQEFFVGDYLLAIATSPSTTTFTGNWDVLSGDGVVHSWAGMQGVITDQEIIDTLVRLGFVRNSGVVNPSIHQFTIPTIAQRVDLNTDLNVQQTVSFSVTNHGDIASMTVQADPVVQDTFINVATLTNPPRDGLQTEQVTFSGLTTDTEKTISFRIRAVDNQGSVHFSNEYDVSVRNLQIQERTHFGFILSTEDQSNIIFADDDIEAREQTDGNWTVSGIPADSSLHRIYWAVPSSQTSISRVTQSGFVLYNSAATTGNQFTEFSNVTIGGETYNVLLMDAANAVNSNYNGSILTVS